MLFHAQKLTQKIRFLFIRCCLVFQLKRSCGMCVCVCECMVERDRENTESSVFVRVISFNNERISTFMCKYFIAGWHRFKNTHNMETLTGQINR